MRPEQKDVSLSLGPRSVRVGSPHYLAGVGTLQGGGQGLPAKLGRSRSSGTEKLERDLCV